jgi:ubiquinone/menaquinone biosynthesis methyltransferase
MLRVGEGRAVDKFGIDCVWKMEDGDVAITANDAANATHKPLRFKEANAEKLPFPDGSFDCYTIAFGLRNVTNPSIAIAEAYRVLKPGGRMLILEFSHPTNAAFSKIYDAYSFNVIPPMGAAVAGDEASYRYLVESIRKWDVQEALKERMETEGFRGVRWEDLNGGICAIHSGWKIV